MATQRTGGLTGPSPRVVLDSGAVIGLARSDLRARAALAAAHEAGAEIVVPAVVVAETVRGAARDAPVNRVLKAVGNVAEVDEECARVAGGLLGSTRSSGTVDALVVATAVVAGGAVILTGDPDDLRRLAERHTEVVVQAL